MKDEIRCSECHYMKIPYRTNAKGNCYCEHPDVRVVLNTVFTLKNHNQGFICYTEIGTDTPSTKTSPRWCPRRILKSPIEIDCIGAKKVIEDCKPLGLFYCTKDGYRYTGVDNKTGVVRTSDFDSKSRCVEWLKKSQK